MSELHLYNSLSRKKEGFSPLDPSCVRLYACGPTVYSYAHIGNARMAVVFDLLVRVLKKTYKTVKYVSNITDVDDKIILASKDTGEDINTITRRYETIYNQDMAALGVCSPDVQPRATAHIAEMIRIIDMLIQRGHAYAAVGNASGHVLFHVPSFPAYGGLSGRSRDEQIAGARVEVSPFKKDPADFILWKPSEGEEPGWDSPWGFGRPGWHIECSAMAEKHLGLPFDIHGGGADLKFPHHENEIAQSCCAHGHMNDLSAFAKFWVHNGFVTVNGEKMSKSLGNVMLVHDLLKDWPGEALRLTLLSAHYRQPLDLSIEKIRESKETLDGFYRILKESADTDFAAADMQQKIAPFMAALLDDLNTPMAIAELHALAKHVTKDKNAAARAALLAAGKIMGLLEESPDHWLGYGGDNEDPVFVQKVEALLNARAEARKNKNFAAADSCRNQLTEMGVIIEDTPAGTTWRRA